MSHDVIICQFCQIEEVDNSDDSPSDEGNETLLDEIQALKKEVAMTRTT